MANMRLRETILAVVDNQLRDNDPPCTRRAYERLQKAGYSRKEVKEKLAAVVLEEIYDVMSQNQPFDEERFERALDDMVQRCIDYEDDSGLPSGWDEIAGLIDEGWEYAENQDYENMTRCWLEAWDKTKENVKQAEIRLGISAVDEATDYEYDIGGWLHEMELELFNAKAHEIRIQFCHEVLDTFDWEYDDHGGFKTAIGESLNALGRRDEGKKRPTGWWTRSWETGRVQWKTKPYSTVRLNWQKRWEWRTGCHIIRNRLRSFMKRRQAWMNMAMSYSVMTCWMRIHTMVFIPHSMSRWSSPPKYIQMTRVPAGAGRNIKSAVGKMCRLSRNFVII